MVLWYRLLPQADLNLNIVRLCCMNPLMSAYTALEGEFDYNTTPLELLGSLVIAGITPDQRPS